ncbi:hypothetical protein IFM89_012235 [Coptis chinensis]|uniref:SAGA-associated factor 11 n=1 Tax=Coptis chinensis TaxID=261450 RepID=A0A835HBY3_9MAGN|nr:hypothetical protein IFM89_012235 [Coptis chinensis]
MSNPNDGDASSHSQMSSHVLDELLESIIVDVASECHRIARLGLDRNLEEEEEELRLSTQARARVADPSHSGESNSKYVIDIFGQTHPAVANEIFECMNCGRSIMAGRFAPHLEKCMGKGRKARLKTTRSSTATQSRNTRGSPGSTHSPYSNSTNVNRVANGTALPGEDYEFKKRAASFQAMPKSKRNRAVTLSKTKKKGRGHKEEIVNTIRQAIENYNSIYVFTYENMRNLKFKEFREQLKSTSRFFLGSNKVMQVSLGRSDSDEIRPGLYKVSKLLRGNSGLFFTNLPKEEVVRLFEEFKVHDFARTGSTITEKVELKEGPLDQFTHEMEPFLRKQGMPVRLNKGVVELVSDFVVCEEGSSLSPESARILVCPQSFSCNFVHLFFCYFVIRLHNQGSILFDCLGSRWLLFAFNFSADGVPRTLKSLKKHGGSDDSGGGGGDDGSDGGGGGGGGGGSGGSGGVAFNSLVVVARAMELFGEEDNEKKERNEVRGIWTWVFESFFKL